MKRNLLCFFLVVAAHGCSSLSYTIDRDLLSEITLENKLSLFDAENDVSIAVDEKEQIQRQIQGVKQDIADAEAQIAEAESDAARASAKSDAKGEAVASAAQDVYDYKISYLEAYIAFLRKKLAAQEGLILVAYAKYELAKAKLVKKNNVRGASDIEEADFEAQVDSYVEKARAEQESLAEEEKEVEAVKKEWLTRREQLQSQSGGGVGSPWAEDSALWGSQ